MRPLEKKEHFHQKIYEGIEKNEITSLLADYEQCVLDYVILFQERYMRLSEIDKMRLLGGTEEERKKTELLINKLSTRNYFMRIINNPNKNISQAYEDMRMLIKNNKTGSE